MTTAVIVYAEPEPGGGLACDLGGSGFLSLIEHSKCCHPQLTEEKLTEGLSGTCGPAHIVASSSRYRLSGSEASYSETGHQQ